MELKEKFDFGQKRKYMLPSDYVVTSIKGGQKFGRNKQCYCGSGKKYKKCCFNIKPAIPVEQFVDEIKS